MSRIPGISEIAKLSIGKKLGIQVGVLFVPIVALLGLTFMSRLDTIGFTEKEDSALDHVQQLNHVMADSNTLRELTAAAASGDAAAKSALTEQRDEVLGHVANVRKADKGAGSGLNTSKLTTKLEAAVTDFISALETGSRPEAIQAKHDALVGVVKEYLFVAGDRSNLYFDPERAALFAILSELELVPDLNNAVHRIQVRLESAAAAGTISANDRAAVEADIAVAQNAMSELSRNLQASVDDNPAYRAVIVRPLDEARAGVDAFVASARSSVNASRPVRLDASELHQSTENMSDAVHGALANDLAQRISSDRTALAVVSGVSLAGLAIAIGAAFYIARSITKPINELVLAADRISLGDLEAQIGTQGSPEVDKLATSLRRMQSSLRTAIERLRARRAAA